MNCIQITLLKLNVKKVPAELITYDEF